MSARIERESERACAYDSLKAIQAESRRQEQKIFGWARSKFYEVWPGGRTIDWTGFASEYREDRPNMTEKINAEVVAFNKLTGKYKHFCLDWDGMAIDENCPEFESCLCFKDEPPIEDPA